MQSEKIFAQNLSLENFSFAYEKIPVLKNINFTLAKNDFTCLVGPNGCGKSTLLKALLNSIGACGERSEKRKSLSAKERARIAAYLPQNESPLWNYSVFETVLQGRFCRTGKFDLYSKTDYEIAEKTIFDFGIAHLKNKSIKEISGGEFQKVRLARAFAQQSDFLILDEPVTSLDFVAAEKFMQELKEKSHNIGVLISIHDVNLALRFAKKIALLGKYDEATQSQFFAQKNPDASEELEIALSKIYGEKILLKNISTSFALFSRH